MNKFRTPKFSHTDRVNAIALGTIDSQTILATASSDNSVHVWDISRITRSNTRPSSAAETIGETIGSHHR